MYEKTKEWLEALERKDREICLLMNEISKIRELATSVGGVGSPVQSSGGDRLGKIIANLADKENELDAVIDEYIDERREKIKVINQIEDNNIRDVIYFHYAQFMPMTKIAEKLNYSYIWVHKMNTIGIEKIDSLLKEYI